ncbi:hypothetical protein [Pseudonocardia kunmingensis]|uniref:Formamidopyrimidine-DNA glycosylase-like protein n=1 Tax=Pseudonocardia kunmingensis TaxID=630975 RepID=A0A543DNQ0_9PSEU|nr:hypothetical protein [Pseudonocardia kunmingensis]TQM10961.1 formamidopyrimidine-DNA glycosylase-like protein [Pseudonocardia kunmingensis]
MLLATIGRPGDGERGGGEPERPDRTPRKPEWDRFTVTFTDGGHLRLFDKRRLGRVRLEPDLSVLGPDAETIGRDEFRTRVARSRAPVKARLLDQGVLAGVGNLLADEILWQAAVRPAAPADELGGPALDRLHAAMGRAIGRPGPVLIAPSGTRRLSSPRWCASHADQTPGVRRAEHRGSEGRLALAGPHRGERAGATCTPAPETAARHLSPASRRSRA